MAGQCIGRRQGAGVFSYDVAGTTITSIIQPGSARFQSGQIEVAQRLDPVVTGGRFALLTAGVVLAVHQTATHIGVDDQHRQIRRHGDEAGLQRAAVEQQGVVSFAAGGDHLIHDAAVAADELVLRLLAVEGDLGLADIEPQRFFECLTDGYFQRGGGGEPRPLRHVAGDHQIEAAQGITALLQILHHAADVVAPALAGVVLDGLVEVELVALVVVVGGDHLHLPVIAQADGNAGLVVDGAGQHEAVVVVGMFTDEVDATWGAHQQIGRFGKLLGKNGADALAGGHRASSLVWLVWV